jgi:hypothetical protein
MEEARISAPYCIVASLRSNSEYRQPLPIRHTFDVIRLTDQELATFEALLSKAQIIEPAPDIPELISEIE